MTNESAPTFSRGVLTAMIAVAAVAALLAVIYAALWIGDIQREFLVEVPVATPLERTPIVAGTTGESTVAYNTVLISSYEPLTDARFALAMAVALRFAVFFGACGAVIVLAVRLWHRRPFTRLATGTLGSLGVFAVAVGFIASWLTVSGIHSGVTALGFPLSGDSAPGALEDAEWIVPPTFALQDADWILLGLGVLLCLIAGLMAHGQRLQRDTEGLV